MHSYLSVLKIALHGRSASKILLATIFSFTFSIAVILCTFGLMDGFDYLLKSGLRHSSGDILVTNRRGFFALTPELLNKISILKPLSVAPVIQSEAFLLSHEVSKGVAVRGIEDKNFSDSTGLRISVPPGGIALGKELSEQLKIKVHDTVALTFGRGSETASTLPLIQTFLVSSIIQHGIYQKDLRFVYINRSDLSLALGTGEKINLLILGTEPRKTPLKSLDTLSTKQRKLKNELGSEFIVKPFWNEYDFLIEAVKVEKFSISLILQLIVVVAVFNIIAFVIYIMEKKAQDFFFLRAVGLSLKVLSQFWLISVILIWSLSCMGAHVLSLCFNWSLQNLSFLQIPGEVYVLSSLSIKLDTADYFIVYGISLIWILLASFIGYLRLKKKPIIQGLRQEFS
jgi:ABC-type lipoprotein release transport system permease subunit